jgi:hypothetical protein
LKSNYWKCILDIFMRLISPNFGGCLPFRPVFINKSLTHLDWKGLL